MVHACHCNRVRAHKGVYVRTAASPLTLQRCRQLRSSSTAVLLESFNYWNPPRELLFSKKKKKREKEEAHARRGTRGEKGETERIVPFRIFLPIFFFFLSLDILYLKEIEL